ncbi:MAG: hypothetical protein [Bacteriophage sp.]|nr:MAG: hypothetical protein [Bacteriophage sp.]
MKWYETPLTVQWDNALELLKQGKVEAYTKMLKRVYILCMERNKQRHVDVEMPSALALCAADEDGRFERYTREMRRCNQVICRIRRERARRAKAR